MSLTITIPGAVDVTTGSTAPAVLTIGVGVPGAAGPQGPAGQGVPAGGTSGQYLQKIDGTNYNTDWVTLNLSSYLTTSAAASTYYPLTNPSGYITASALSPYLLSSTAASTYQTQAGMSSYLTSASAALTYATIAQGQPASGTIGQVLTKNSGTNYDSSWQTLIPGDRYLTSSTTSLTIDNNNKTLTIGTGLSYTPQQDVVIAYDASNHMHAQVLTYNSGTGVMTVDVQTHTGSGTYTAWTVNVGGVVPATSVTWGSITGTLGDQTDLATALNAKLDSATATTTYAPIASPTFTGVVTIPAGASISGYAPLASPALTGNVSITSNSTGAALFIEQAGTGNILTLHDQATDTNFVAIDQNGKVNTIPSEATNGAGFNIAHGVAPTTPVNGDIWTTTSGLFARINAGTKQLMNLGDTQTVSGNITFSNASSTYGSSTATGTINVASGATISASTKTVNVATGGVVGSTTLTTIGPVLGASTTSIGGTTAASTLNLATGATISGSTKTVNIGTAGVAGSTTNIAIGSTTGTSTTTLQGITNGVTQTAGDSSLKLATTAFVTTADNLKANLASPALTGVPTAPTATDGTNTTQIATTAFVTAAVPALATAVQARAFTSTTTAMSPRQALWAMLSQDVVYVQRDTFTVTNVGTITAVNGGNLTTQTRPGTAGACSSRARIFGFAQVDQQYNMEVKSNPVSFTNFSFRKIFSGRSMVNGVTDTNFTWAWYHGKAEADGVGDLVRRGFGWKMIGGAGSRFLLLQVHNGTTLASVTSSFAVTAGVAFDWDVESDGAGNVTLYVNGTSVATSSAGPTGLINQTSTVWQEEFQAAAALASPFNDTVHSRGRYVAINP